MMDVPESAGRLDNMCITKREENVDVVWEASFARVSDTIELDRLSSNFENFCLATGLANGDVSIILWAVRLQT